MLSGRLSPLPHAPPQPAGPGRGVHPAVSLRVALAGQGSRGPQPRPPLPASETVKAARPCQHLRHPSPSSPRPSSPRKTLFLPYLKNIPWRRRGRHTPVKSTRRVDAARGESASRRPTGNTNKLLHRIELRVFRPPWGRWQTGQVTGSSARHPSLPPLTETHRLTHSPRLVRAAPPFPQGHHADAGGILLYIFPRHLTRLQLRFPGAVVFQSFRLLCPGWLGPPAAHAGSQVFPEVSALPPLGRTPTHPGLVCGPLAGA